MLMTSWSWYGDSFCFRCYIFIYIICKILTVAMIPVFYIPYFICEVLFECDRLFIPCDKFSFPCSRLYKIIGISINTLIESILRETYTYLILVIKMKVLYFRTLWSYLSFPFNKPFICSDFFKSHRATWS